MTENLLTDAELAAINERARALADELLAAVDLGDRQLAYLSAMQLLIARSGLGPQQVIDALTSLIAHNLCEDQPIRLAILPAEVGEVEEPPKPVVH